MHATLSRHTEDIKGLRMDATQLQEHVLQTEELLQSLSNTVVEMEDRARRDNVVIFSLQEGIEGSSMLAYLKEKVPRWFPSFARGAGSPANPEMMSAHRLDPAPRTTSAPSRGQRPCPVNIKLLYFTDRDVLLNEAREKPPEVAVRLLKLAADYSEVTSKHRRPCYKIMYEAHTQGFNAFLIYPGIIKLHRRSENYSFTQPLEAEKFLASLKGNSTNG